MKIHQILNSISQFDAVSNQAMEMRNVLQKAGHDSRIFVRWKDTNLKDDSIITLNSASENEFIVPDSLAQNDIVIFHHFNESLLLNILKKINRIKVLYYHNITPPHFFNKFDTNLASSLQKGYDQLDELKSTCQIVSATSEFNKIELERFGFNKISVIPIYVNENRFQESSTRIFDKNKSYDNLLFVGRHAPNKRIEDLIKIFYYYSNFINPNSRLFLTGNIDFNNLSLYQKELVVLIKKLNLENKVIFTGKIDHDELLSLYRIADVFICMSEHEGFCVPLVEAMFMKVPIIAFDSTSISYTLGNVGIIVKEKNYRMIAELVHKMIIDNSLKEKVIDEQFKFAKEKYGSQNFAKSLLTMIDNIRK